MMWLFNKQIWMMVLMATGLAGCAANGPSTTNAALPARTASAAHAECLVCKKNADLACVDVDIDGKTPSCDYNGKRYYFCSDECRTEFQENPTKFTGMK